LDSVTLNELEQIIRNSGGASTAVEYAARLLEKIHRLEATGRYEQLFQQLRSCREQGDLRGRVLEINFADQFLRNNQKLGYGVQQGMSGDIDFLWCVSGMELYIEMKLLRQDKETRDAMNAQIEAGGVFSTLISDDTRDIARMQLDLIGKATTRKFNPKPQASWINLVGMDVAELQLGMVDSADCVLAAAGNNEVRRFYPHGFFNRPDVIGLFERPVEAHLTQAQKNWVSAVHRVPSRSPHPRDYIHGALFLFREPKDTAALSYGLSTVAVWNSALIMREQVTSIWDVMKQFVPFAVD